MLNELLQAANAIPNLPDTLHKSLKTLPKYPSYKVLLDASGAITEVLPWLFRPSPLAPARKTEATAPLWAFKLAQTSITTVNECRRTSQHVRPTAPIDTKTEGLMLLIFNYNKTFKSVICDS